MDQLLYALDMQAAITFFSVFGSFFLIKNILISRLNVISSHTRNHWDDALARAINQFSWIFYFALSLYITIRTADLKGDIISTANKIILVIGALYVARAMSVFLVLFTDEVVRRKNIDDPTHNKGIMQIVKFGIHFIVWAVTLVLILQNLGYNVTALVGGLGIAGIAIGLAVQNVLADLFSFISIYFDKPFKIGDFIIIGNDMGTVEKIGVKSTRLRTMQGQLLVVPNQELTSSRINNYELMERRRIEFTFGITYETSKKKLDSIPDMVMKLIENVDNAEPERVYFKSFGDSALIFETIYYVEKPDFDTHLNVRHTINSNLHAAFKKAKISMAYPTQTVYVHKEA